MIRRRALLLAVVAAAVAACGHPGIPASVVAQPPPTATSAPAATATASALAAPARPILGVDLYAPDNYPAGAVTGYGRRMLGYIKNTLHADAVGIVWDYYMTTDSASWVERTPGTLTPPNVAILTRIAQADGLQVQYRPLIFVTGRAPQTWEGLVLPRRPRAWFASYYRAERPYLRLAQRFHVGEFVAATELHMLNSSPLWSQFFAQARGDYHGVISYAAWDGDYFASHVPAVPKVGMDMYTRLPLAPGASQAQVTAGWEQAFARLPVALLRRSMIDETGIEARAGAYRNPPAMGARGRPDEQVQAYWFLAGCHAVSAEHLRGMFIWKVDLADNPAHPTGALSVFEGRQGAAAISACAHFLHQQ